MPQQIRLNGWDLTIFIVYMFISVGLGFIVSIGRKKTTRGYFLGGKTLPWYVIASSMLASDVSSEHFIANAGIGFTYGIVSATASWNCWIIYTIFIWIFLPYYVRTNLYTIPEFLERRYSSVCRYIFSVVTGAYTIYGGLRSAAWTDFMQNLILGAGGVLVPILGLLALRGSGGFFHMVH